LSNRGIGAHVRAAGIDLPIDDLSPPRREVGFEAGTFDELGCPPSGLAHRHVFYEVAYISCSHGSHVIDSRAYRLHAATLFFLRPEQVHAWVYDRPIKGFLLTFTEDFLRRTLRATEGGSRDQRLIHGLADIGPIRLGAEDARDLLPVFKAMMTEYMFARDGYVSVLQAYLHILVMKTLRLCSAADELPAGRSCLLVRRFVELVAQPRQEHRSVKAYSDMLGVTPGYLAEAVRQVMGRTPGQVIRASLVLDAKRLLTYTEMTVAEIAYELGFADAAYFGRFFKRECGITPGGFRQDTLQSRRFGASDLITPHSGSPRRRTQTHAQERAAARRSVGAASRRATV
jgi:AraC family transcriptional regulator, transcriptional activator of pobA